MHKSLFMMLPCILLVAACGASDLRQQLDAARANRDAAIQQQMQTGTMSPAEAQDILSHDHAHDAAFDRNQALQSIPEPVSDSASTSPYPSMGCPACEEGREQAEGITSYQSSQPAPIEGIINSYNNPPPASMGIGEGARGWDGKTYIPAGADPNPPPNIMGQ